jgi:fructokinase
MSRLPFVVVGEALVDIVVPLDGEPSEAVGGSPMNVAVGLARLDVPAVLLTRIGDDAHGRAVAEHVRGSGVTLPDSSVVPGSATSTATALLDAEHAARYEFDLVWDLASQQLPDAAGLHVGSLGASLAPGRETVLDLVRQAAANDVFVSYDPNIRPAFVTDRTQAWRDVLEVAALAQLVKVSDEDLAALRPGEDEAALVQELMGAGAAELVIVTRGAGGATAYAQAWSISERTPPVDVVDTVGAGDAFMAATLAILDDWEIPEDGPGALAAVGEEHVGTLLRGAMAAAAVTCSRRGANPPTRRELPPTWPA